jgi:hypothetical protein
VALFSCNAIHFVAARIRTPGRSSLRNSMPAFSRARFTSESVPVRAPISPSNDSMRRIVLMATPDFFARVVCSQPASALAAFSCRPVIKREI